MEWWELPGPSSFVSEISNDLRDGKNVIVCLPEHSPDGLRTAVRSLRGDDVSWSTLSCEEMGDRSPLDWLSDQFPVNEESPSDIRDISNFLKRDCFVGRIIWLGEMRSDKWSRWRDFLSKYEHVCRGIDLLRRTVFCILLSGVRIADLPHEDVCLVIRKYQNKVSPLDIQLFTWDRRGGSPAGNLLEELRLEIVANLAQWDGKLAEWLLKRSLNDLLNVDSILQEEAQRRGWCDAISVLGEKAWSRGITYCMDSREVVHSCIFSLRNSEALCHRIWKSQLRVLYPFVEEQRQMLLKQLKNYLSVPYTTRFGEIIKDIRDLEIGHIEAILKGNNRFRDQSLLDRIAALREIRNHLAHMEIVDLRLLELIAIK